MGQQTSLKLSNFHQENTERHTERHTDCQFWTILSASISLIHVRYFFRFTIMIEKTITNQTLYNRLLNVKLLEKTFR